MRRSCSVFLELLSYWGLRSSSAILVVAIGTTMTFEERAKLIWNSVKDNLCDRGLFNGIDTQTEKEIDKEQVAAIATKLAE